jgi:hypothetical protein
VNKEDAVAAKADSRDLFQGHPLIKVRFGKEKKGTG